MTDLEYIELLVKENIALSVIARKYREIEPLYAAQVEREKFLLSEIDRLQREIIYLKGCSL